jgi:transposase
MPKSKEKNASNQYEEEKKRTQTLYKEIVDIHVNEGISVRAIAAKVNVGKSSVSRYIRSWKNGVAVEDMKPYCRPPKINPVHRSFLGQCVASQAKPTSKSLANALSTSKGISVSPQTVRTHLKALDYKSSRPRKIPLMTTKQERARVGWCVQHTDFNWSNVWFSDETYIEINQSTLPVWHKKSEKPTVAKPKFAVKIMCWGAISTRFKTKLAIVQGTMTAQRYVDTLQGYLFTGCRGFEARKAVFQQDNASSHTAKLTKLFFESQHLTVLPWPANSPDLNPIENIWAILKQNVERRVVRNKDELVKVVEDEWSKIDQDLIRKTIDSMPKRMTQVIERGGKKCDY